MNRKECLSRLRLANNLLGSLAAVATLVQAVVVIISIGLIKDQLKLQSDQLKVQTDQLKQQTDLAKAANLHALTALGIPMNLEEVKDPEIARLLLTGAQGFKKQVRFTRDEVKEDQYRTLIATWLLFYENMFYQHSQKLLADEVYEPWDKDLETFVTRYRIGDYWAGMRASYHEDFRKRIDEILRNNQSSENP